MWYIKKRGGGSGRRHECKQSVQSRLRYFSALPEEQKATDSSTSSSFFNLFFFRADLGATTTTHLDHHHSIMSDNPPKHHLLYFDAPGRAEVIRICFFIAGVPFADERCPYKDWASRKPTTPLGSMPVLTIDGTVHVQSTSLARYAGRLAGWYPTDALDCLVVDEVYESLNELLAKAPRSGDPQEFYKLRQAYQETEMTKYATFLEGKIQENGGIGFTSQPTIADLFLQLFVSSVARGVLDHVEMNFFDKYPGIMATCKMIEESPDILAYYASKKEP